MINKDEPFNVASYLVKTAENMPWKRAVVAPRGTDKQGNPLYTQLTFEELNEASDRVAAGLVKEGITNGTRTILMVRPSLEFFILTFALFKAGAVPVVVDPGMGLKRMLSCLQESSPEGFVGIPLAHVVRVLFPKYFKSVSKVVTVGKRYFWRGNTLKGLLKDPSPPVMANTKRGDTAAILFTTGSTGPAKGVVYTHGTFDAQIKQIQAHFNIGPDEIDLPTFPLFALFDPALGMTAVIPEMDPTKPAKANPEKIIGAIEKHGITNMFASPALLNRVGKYGKENDVHLASLRRVVSAGAPVHPANIEQFSTMLNMDTEIHTPYGATEAVPILSIGSHEILSETRPLSEKGYGTCIGYPIHDVMIELINVTDDPIQEWSDDLCISAPGEVGEIVVQGPVVTREYYKNERANKLAKIDDGDAFWHRMGDLGWRDQSGRIWFCGRKSHRVITSSETLYTIPCESIYNNHPEVYRSALVGVGEPGEQKPVICIELTPDTDKIRWDEIQQELFELASQSPNTQQIDTLLRHDSFPVDIRHNAKIFREQLALWAAEQL